jgi:hypothetical protein
MLRVQDQAKQAAWSRPPISFSFSKEKSFCNTRSQVRTKGPQISRRYLKQTH